MLVVLVGFLYAQTVWSQTNRYMVFFTDKAGTIFSVDEPEAFLSPRAISRRTKQGIAILPEDLPVNKTYIDDVASTGAEVYFKTKWMNGVLIQCDQSLLTTIRLLPFVQRIERVAPGQKLIPNGRRKSAARTKGTKTTEYTDDQLLMLGIPQWHEQEFRGEGMNIAVFDSGFSGVDDGVPFEDLFTDNRILLTTDFVFNTPDVYQYDDHGTAVLSVIGAYQQDVFTGGAHQSTFQLYVTEDVASEYRIEEYNWLFAAERADSAGVDIINSSLGYYDFDDSSMNYSQSDMDGNTAVVTRAARMATAKGIVVVCSAGNEGNNAWQLITAPADGKDVLAVGSVNRNRVRVASSSKGPTADGRIKPDVAAMGASTAVVFPSGTIGTSSGTSFAAPLITSLVSVLWQANPELSNIQLMDAIRRSASQSATPDNLLGYGVPSTTAFTNYLDATDQQDMFLLYPNPVVGDTLWIRPKNPDVVTSCLLELTNATGQKLGELRVSFNWQEMAYPVSVQHLASGLYNFRIRWNDRAYIYRVVKVE